MTTLRRPLHDMPGFVREALIARGLERVRRPPSYQRNDYLGWIAGAKRAATRRKRLAQMLDELEAGDRFHPSV